MTITRLLRFACGFVLGIVFFVCAAMGQTETATVSGLITDDTGAVVPGAEVKLQSIERGTVESGTTNNAGIYVFASVHPGQYQLTVQKPGFKQIDFLGLIVNVQDHIEQNFRLQVGSVAESVTVEASAMHVNTTDATVSTVIDRQFAENLPLNGRSFQTLIQLTPGVVLTANTGFDQGQFSVNGQRPVSNYWMVDGVAANIGISGVYTPSNGLAGSLGSSSATGGTNSLVSVDALQEFRIQTSTYAPEFGRTPGGQISIVTRSGTNQFHGAAFDYLRNDAFDANNWFNGYTNNPPLPKAKERQNDFGGTFSGPILQNKTFFFFSYEGLRLRLPETSITTVPDLTARQNAMPAMQPFFNAYPIPNGPDDLATGIAQFAASYSNPATLDAYSIRIDHKLTDKFTIFGRFNYSPSNSNQRGSNALNVGVPAPINTLTTTIGATWLISPTTVNDLRFNYSKTDARYGYTLDSFGGGVPVTSIIPFPSGYSTQNSFYYFDVYSLQNGGYAVGKDGHNAQRQFNLVDSFSKQKGSHALKFGADLRLLSPVFDPPAYAQQAYFNDVPAAEKGILDFGYITASNHGTFLFPDLGIYAQDTWKITSHLTLTYGLRWDIEFPPSSLDGPSLPALTNFNINDLSQVGLAPAGTPPFDTKFGNVAPRVGLAYQLSPNQNWGRILRGGFGIFYDMSTSEIGNIFQFNYPFSASAFPGGTYPLPPSAVTPPVISIAELKTGTLGGTAPNLNLPYTREWNVALEQSLGSSQTITASYIGAAGRRLLQPLVEIVQNATTYVVEADTNTSTSDYEALQVQFQRRLSHGLQALLSYSWAHSIDTASGGVGNIGSYGSPSLNGNANRGSSDFDLRNAFTSAITYDVPTPKTNAFAKVILGGWSTENIIQAHSAPPVNITDSAFYLFKNTQIAIRPDVNPGQPFYLYGPQYPGGKAINPKAFKDPPADPNNLGAPLRQGNVGRNSLRGFGLTQWDFAVHRDFPMRESLKLQFRAEMFNVLNHPNFGAPNGALGTGGFGIASQMYGQYLTGGYGGEAGAFSPLYQIGGPRSIQLALKLSF